MVVMARCRQWLQYHLHLLNYILKFDTMKGVIYMSMRLNTESNPEQERRKQIEHNFTYHSPKPGQPEKYTQIREKYKELALLICDLTPYSREQSLALTELEYSCMMANAAIARHE